MEETIENFMGIFPNAASKEYCEKVIKWFEFNKKGGHGGKRTTLTRQENEPNTKRTFKDSEQYFFEAEDLLLESSLPILHEFNGIIWKAYEQFKKKYGAALDDVAFHKVSASVKIQKYEASQGYHVWHCDNSNMLNSRRMLVCTLYSNTVEEGGETEFLYQRKRVPAIQGTLSLSPAGWTHLHRGNPPLKGNKYIINTWLEFFT